MYKRKYSVQIYTHTIKDRFDQGWNEKPYHFGRIHTIFYIVVFLIFCTIWAWLYRRRFSNHSKLKKIKWISELETEWSSQNPGSFKICQDIINTIHHPGIKYIILFCYYFFTRFEWIFTWCIQLLLQLTWDSRESRKCLFGLEDPP